MYIYSLFTEGDEVVEEKFKSRAPLLLKYYDTKPDRELFALTALEELMDQLQHPSSEYFQ